MTKMPFALVLAFTLAAPVLAAPSKSAAPTAGAVAFDEKTTVHGKVPVDLSGWWFVVPHLHMARDPKLQKFRTMPEIIRITYGKDGTPNFNLLDARLPPKMADTIKTLNDKLEPWTPTPDDLKLLAKELPRMKATPDSQKDVVKGDVAYAEVLYTVAAPDTYAEVFPRQDPAMAEVLSGSQFSIQVMENYRGLPLPPGSNVAPLMQRTSVYGVRSATPNLIEGTQVVGFIAAGIGQPIPIGTAGAFKMYKLASVPRDGAGPAKKGAPAKPAKAKTKS